MLLSRARDQFAAAVCGSLATRFASIALSTSVSRSAHTCTIAMFGSSADNAAILRWEPDPQFQDTMRMLAAVLSPTHEQGNVGRGIRVFNYAEGIDRSLNRSASFSRRPLLRMCCSTWPDQSHDGSGRQHSAIRRPNRL